MMNLFIRICHEHEYDAGMWRAHSQGLDITFDGKNGTDGGILIRGLHSAEVYTNGPRRVVTEIFKCLGSITQLKHDFGLIRKTIPAKNDIYKTSRHGLSASLDKEFKNAFYRYYVNIDNWNPKHFSNTLKDQIKSSNPLQL